MNPREILEAEGFKHIYEWHDEPGTVYQSHSHKGKVSLFIVNGGLTYKFADKPDLVVSKGERFDVPPGQEHSAFVGPDGCDYVVGEMIEGDS